MSAMGISSDRLRFPVDEWRLVESGYSADDLGLTETLFAVGNGYLGMRGNVEEGRPSFAHGTFVNGFHETWPIRHAEDAYGFAKVGQTIVNVPDAKIMRLYVDDEPLLLPDADLASYTRSLGFDDGVLRRELVWRTPSGKQVLVRSERMVSFAQRHLALATLEVTVLDADAPVVVSCQVLNRQDGQDEYHVPAAAMGEGVDPRKAQQFNGRVLEPVTHWGDDARVVLSYRCANSGMTLAVAADHRIETDNPVAQRTQVEADLAKHVYRVDATAGRPIKITKLIAYHTSRGVPVRELVDRCRRTLDRAGDLGVKRLQAEQREWLDGFWARSDVRLPGQPDVQQAVRWNLFQLAQASGRAETNGIPAKGVTGSGYSGHYFWDTEIYVLPFLTYTTPRLARSALRFRYSMLDAARRRAAEVTQAGALFPWRTINGEEASAYYAAGTAQYHIDADISYALAQYVAASGDDDFMIREGVDILVETARMWEDLGFWRANGDEAFHIHGVTGPDEYTTVVNDNLFTNVMARFNLWAAVDWVRTMQLKWPAEYEAMASRLSLRDEEVDAWARAAELMEIPYNERLGIHPQDSHFLEREMWDLAATPPDRRPLLLHYHPLVIYRFQVLKQADVVLAHVLQGEHFPFDSKRADFEYYDPITTGDSTLSAVAQSIIASEVGYNDLAVEYFSGALYVDLDDLHHNTVDGVHVASLGGVWSTLVHGFAGMRDPRGRITFDPRLPDAWAGIEFSLALGASRVSVALTRDAIEFDLLDGEPVTLWVRGERVDVHGAVRVPLADQGPRIAGRPTSGALVGARREDGTLITATVPETPEPLEA